MRYDPHKKARAEIMRYIRDNDARFPGVAAQLTAFLADPKLDTAKTLMGAYFRLHRKDDIESLRMITSTFADKALVKKIVESIIADDNALASIASKSYPHPIGFDKLVLYDDPTGFKFRLHIYWRGNQRAAMERMHLHRFEMASAIVTGELTNHTWRVADYRPENTLIPAIELTGKADDPARAHKTMYAYSGYWRDPQDRLHKKILGECDMVRGESDTFVSGEGYAQVLSDAHYVETNAETGKTNGDVCSTIYVHSGGLADAGGRKMPVLFEEFRLANPDQIVESIPAMTPESLKASLTKYRDFIDENLKFYEWLYDPKHGRDLSVGMIAGYLLSESQHSPHTISMWIDHEKECKAVLDDCSKTLAKLVRGEMKISDLSDDDRNKRYYAILLNKVADYAGGGEQWLRLSGNLVKEMWRYCGALKGEKPDVTVLKPIWENVVGKKMPGGAHYGHIAAMIEAAYAANAAALKHFNAGLETRYKEDGSPVSNADIEIGDLIQSKLAEYYPDYDFASEENESAMVPAEGNRRFLVDPIDGTRNFLSGRDDFCVSIACQTFKNGKWDTTDGVVSIPVSGKMYWAEQGKGAYLIERTDLERQLQVKAAREPGLKNRLIDLSISGFGVNGEAAIVHKLRSEGAVYRVHGSAAMILAMAAGQGSDGVIMTAHDHDIAAAKLIAEEAGATVSQFNFTRGGVDHCATVAGADPDLQRRLRTVAVMAAAQNAAPRQNWTPPAP
jgi:fructose-1,6-bisphosphatase/inositol monophosphatase family enzyme